MSWEAFEELCMIVFQKQGWRVLGNEKKGADGGVDLWMKRRMRRAIVQCKRYEDAMVTVKVIREMYGLMHEYDVHEVYVVTSSRFTKECYRFVKDKPIVLIDGERLVSMIRKYS
jgi:restriction system protein